jgi:tRNA nucleotidyltransferase/poly(A) polymerase
LIKTKEKNQNNFLKIILKGLRAFFYESFFNIISFFYLYKKNKMPQIFKVGGCVRDKLLGVESKDIDFTFVLDNLDQTVEEGFESMTSWLAQEGFGIFLSTPDCFTIRAKFPKGDKNEGIVADFVMARKEIGYVPGTRQPILVLGTLEDDLIRRDFTLNAMAEDGDGNIIDLFGGKNDLERKILRTPLTAKQTMMDDPLRFLRALRFSITKGFDIDDSIFEAMEQPDIIKKLEKVVSAERIREEVFKMMKHDTVASLELFREVEKTLPGFTKLVFGRGLWLKPTFEL